MEDIYKTAQNFNSDYEKYWNENRFEDLSALYADDAVLVGKDIVQNKDNILSALKNIYKAGWHKIKIESTLTFQPHEAFIIVVNKYEAFGTINGEEKQVCTKSSHVLQNVDGKWVSIMHSAF